MADAAAGQHLPPPLSAPPHRDSWYPYSNGGSHFHGGIAMVLIFIFSALVCALAINTAIRFFLRSNQQQQQQPSDEEDDTKPTNSSDSSLFLSLPTLVYSSENKTKLAGGGECAICLSEFVEGEGVRILPKCKHGFHVKCIEGWLVSHVSCPTCRTACKDDNDEGYDVEAPPPPPPAPPAAVAEIPRPASSD